MAASVVTVQKDFSAGEVDISAKRDEASPIVKAGLRQGLNGRILDSKGWQNRSGRRAVFKETGRVEKILLGANTNFYICFGAGTLRIYDPTGTTVLFTESGRPWANATAKQIVYAIYEGIIYICFPGSVPRVLAWDGAVGFAASDYAETIAGGGQKRTLFYRLSKKSVTMLPSATVGIIDIVFSDNILVPGMVGTRMRFCNRQIQILTVVDGENGTATVIEPLPPSQTLTFSASTGTINIGDEVEGVTSGATGIVTSAATQQTLTFVLLNTTLAVGDAVTGGTSGATGIIISNDILGCVVSLDTSTAFEVAENVTYTGGSFDVLTATGAAVVVQLLPNADGSIVEFATTEAVAGPSGSGTLSGADIGTPQAVSVWDDEVMNGFRGWPMSVTNDQGRLIFTNFPSLPRGIAWSWFGLPNDLYVDASPDGAMLELAPENGQVLFVLPGPDGSEFVFCSNGLWYIPITVGNPLKPGSVVFLQVSRDGCANIQPRFTLEGLFFISAGLTRMMSIAATGWASHPYATNDISELRSHLFTSPVAIAIPSTDGTFSERYIYVLNSDGTLICGKISTAGGVTAIGGQVNTISLVGWLPWNGMGSVAWVAALAAEVTFTTTYAPNAITPVSVIEVLDDTRYLDASIKYNSVPPGLPIPGGKGPLWWLAGGSVDLMDGPLGTRMMGTYAIDANGFLEPQNNAGEDFTSANLVCGQAWQSKFETFIPAMQAGQDVEQRMWPRRILRYQTYVENSSGFVFERLYSGQTGSQLPAPGTVMKQRRISTWNQDEDPTQPPTLRDQSYLDRPLGRAHDPREVIFKDTPGPLTVTEISVEVTI